MVRNSSLLPRVLKESNGHLPRRLSKDVLDSPLEYTKARDLHDAGIVLLQMVLGKDVMVHYNDYHTALSTGNYKSFFPAPGLAADFIL